MVLGGNGGAHALLHMRVMAHLHMPFLAEIGLALHDVAANELLGILGCLRYPGGCIAYQDASASLDASTFQTLITHLGDGSKVAADLPWHTLYQHDRGRACHETLTVALRAPRCCRRVSWSSGV